MSFILFSEFDRSSNISTISPTVPSLFLVANMIHLQSNPKQHPKKVYSMELVNSQRSLLASSVDYCIVSNFNKTDLPQVLKIMVKDSNPVSSHVLFLLRKKIIIKWHGFSIFVTAHESGSIYPTPLFSS